MGFVKPGDQQAGVAAEFPLPSYSRVIVLDCTAIAGIGADAMSYTASLGNKLWLLGIGLYLLQGTAGTIHGGNVRLRCGTGVPVSITSMIDRWSPVVKTYGGLKDCLRLIGEGYQMWLPMRQLYEGQQLRFGIAIENGSATVIMSVLAVLHVSEG